jgi:hypothetical protein
MADQKPPRSSGDDREILTSLLRYQRNSIIRKLEGLDDVAAAWSPVVSATSALWLLVHLANAERSWVLERFAGEVHNSLVESPSDIAAAVDIYMATSHAVDLVIASNELDALCQGDATQPPVNLRWIVAHLLEETARHAGHLDIIVEMINGNVGR